MKHFFILFVAMSICCFAKAQSMSQGLTGKMFVNTEGGNRFEISFFNDKGVDVVLICDWYRNLGQSDMHFSSLGNSISSFKSDLRALQSKYEQWIATAKTNRVQEVEKEIPCKIGFSTFSCDAYAGNSTEVIVQPYFVVRNYVPHCEIRIWQYYYDRQPNYNVWYLSPKDIPFLISAIDKGYQQHITKSTQKQRTEDLFK